MNCPDLNVQPSDFTDAGRFSHLLAGLPHGPGDLCGVVGGLYIHYMCETTIHCPIAPELTHFTG